jgi:hypothetical protein
MYSLRVQGGFAMKTILPCLSLMLLLACAQTSRQPEFEHAFNDLHEAVSAAADPRTTEGAAAFLRAAGPDGFSALREAYAAEVAYRLGEGPQTELDRGTSDRVLQAMNRVSGQYDGWASGLFWHTDRNAALAAAMREGKPVLNLWLLGRLDEEFC